MKITCQTCSAKYTIADEKVRGKSVKIKCKKCGATIVAGPDNGSADGAEAAQEWLVNVADGDQRSLTPAGIAELYQQGVITDDTFAWREGMAEWLGLRSVPEIAAALGDAPAAQPPAEMDEQPTRMGPIGDLVGDDLVAAYGAPAAAAAPVAAPAPRPSAAPRASAPAARRSDARAPSRDLFSAPSEDEEDATRVGASPDFSGGGSGFAPINDKPGPARRNNLAEPVMMGAADGDASGIIDIQKLQGALAAKQGGPPPKRVDDKKVDDIMNLGGGALFASADLSGPALAPPDLSAPPPPAPEPMRPVAAMAAPMPQAAMPTFSQEPKKSSKGPLIGGVIALVAILGAGGAFMATKGKSSEAEKTATAADSAKTTDTKPAETAAKADTTAKAADTTTAKPAETVAAVATNEPADTADLPPGKALTPEEKKRREEALKKKKEEDAAKKTAEADKKKADEEAKKKAEADAAAAAAAAAAPAGDKPFDRAAAGSALGSIAAGVGSCKKGDGPSGSGRIAVTFAPSGNVTTATIEGGDFAGTSVGSCIAARFRSAKVSPFSGSAVTVKKSFTIN